MAPFQPHNPTARRSVVWPESDYQREKNAMDIAGGLIVLYALRKTENGLVPSI